MITLDPASLNTWTREGLERLRYDYNIPVGGLILDVGACKGDFYDIAIRTWPQALFILFEPTTYACEIKKRPEDVLVQAAAWIRDGHIEMGGDFFATSIYEAVNVQYPSVDIAKYCTQPIDLMKINIEGGEYMVVPHLIRTGVISNISNLQVQFHLIDDEDTELMYDEIYAALKQTHELTWQYKFCWENWKRKTDV